MRRDIPPGRLLVIGFILLLLGWLFPFLMMLRLIESTFWLNFLSFGAQVAGLFLGFIGTTMYIRINRNQDH
ncbi:MAG: hypothetical protein ABWK53_12040 [Anaerolineales bacterium]